MHHVCSRMPNCMTRHAHNSCTSTHMAPQCCHNPFPRLSPIYSPLHRPHQSYLTNPSQDFPNLISSDHTQLDPLGLTPSHPNPPPEPQLEQPPTTSGM